MQRQDEKIGPMARAPNAGATMTIAVPAAPAGPPPTPALPPTNTAPAGPSYPVREPPTGLGRFVLWIVILAVGVLGMIDLGGAKVAASTYVAVPLAIVGLALVVRAWYGRGWSLAVFGGLLALALVIVTAAEPADVGPPTSSTWRPLTVEQVDASYAANVGDSILDLSAVDFTGQAKEIRVSLDAGNLTIVVPPQVDTRAEVQVNVGNAVVFDERWGGIGQSKHTVTSLGSDGTGGGELVLRATVNVGNVEVRR